MEDPRYEIENEKVKELMLGIGRRLREQMPEGWGFALEIFEFEHGKSFFYVSSAERETMITALQEFIDREKKLAESENN